MRSLAWIANQTIAAGKGAPDPQTAVNVYLMALSDNDDAGLLPIVGNDDPSPGPTHRYLTSRYRPFSRRPPGERARW